MKKFRTYLTEQYTPIGPPLGSNPGGVHQDGHGNKVYIKYYKNPDQAKVEALTGHIYDHMGIPTTQSRHEVINGKHALVSPWNDNLDRMRPADFENLSPKNHEQIGKMYHAAVLTKNWDIVGLEHDNIVRHRGNHDLYSTDHGGSFHFRARGSAKEYGPDIEDYHTLRHNDQASGHVFNHVLSKDPNAEKAGFEAVRNMDMKHVHNLFQNSGLDNWKDLHKNFVARRDTLLNKSQT